MKKNKKIRYGVVGLGHIAQTAMLPAFAHAHQNSEVVAFVSGDKVKAKKLAQKYKIAHVFDYNEFDHLLSLDLVDALYIALPNHLHVELSLRAMKAGIHVLCEKPLALELSDIQRMGQAAQKNKVKLMTAYRLHFDLANLRAAEICESGKLGRLRYFSSNFSYNIKDPKNIRLQAAAGGGPIWDIGIYCINAVRNIFREEPTEVFAYAGESKETRFKEVEESAGAVLKFADGKLATFNCSFGASQASHFEVVGTKGSICLDGAYEYTEKRELTVTMDEAKNEIHKFKKVDQFAPELTYFSDCILKNKKVEPSWLEGMADVKVILALYKSIQSGKSVKLNPSPRIDAKTRPTIKMRMRYPGVKEPEPIRVRSPH